MGGRGGGGGAIYLPSVCQEDMAVNLRIFCAKGVGCLLPQPVKSVSPSRLAQTDSGKNTQWHKKEKGQTKMVKITNKYWYLSGKDATGVFSLPLV